MIDFFAEFATAFVLGLLTPLTAACVLPLYPGFLAFLSNAFSGKSSRKTIFLFGLLVAVGVITFMFLLGLIFITILQESLNKVVGIISPIAFVILGIASLILIFNIDLGKYFPKFRAPISKNPLKSAFFFGFFFGSIVVPCNPVFIAILFSRTIVITDFIANVLTFVSFGAGMAFPLVIFSIISAAASTKIIGFLSKNTRKINLIAGLIMLAVSIYYLFFVFKIF